MTKAELLKRLDRYDDTAEIYLARSDSDDAHTLKSVGESDDGSVFLWPGKLVRVTVED